MNFEEQILTHRLWKTYGYQRRQVGEGEMGWGFVMEILKNWVCHSFPMETFALGLYPFEEILAKIHVTLWVSYKCQFI